MPKKFKKMWVRLHVDERGRGAFVGFSLRDEPRIFVLGSWSLSIR
jgi:hypothetical protein